MTQPNKAGRPKKPKEDLGLDRSVRLPTRVWEVISERVKRGDFPTRNALIRAAIVQFLTEK